MNSLCKYKFNKNIFKYIFLLIGFGGVLAFINKIRYRNRTAYVSDLCSNLMECHVLNIDDYDKLGHLVYSDGTQIVLDQKTGVTSIVFINADGEIEIVEVSDDDLNELICNKSF